MVRGNRPRRNRPFRPYPGGVRQPCRTAALHPERLDAARIRHVGAAHFPADATLCRPRAPRQVHRHALHPRRRYAGTRTGFAPVLDYLQDTGHPDLAVLLPRRLLPAIRLLLLADGCKGASRTVPPYQTRRHGNAYLLHPSLHSIRRPAAIGLDLPGSAGRRCAGTAQIARFLAYHRAVDGTVSERQDKTESLT